MIQKTLAWTTRMLVRCVRATVPVVRWMAARGVELTRSVLSMIPPHIRRRIVGAATTLAVAALFIGLVWAAMDRGASPYLPGAGVGVGAEAPTFVRYGDVVAARPAGLRSAPDGDASSILEIPAGSPLQVGGRLGDGGQMLWVRMWDGQRAVYGFVREPDVRWIDGTAPGLALRGIDAAALLAPADGIRWGPSQGGPGAVSVGPLTSERGRVADDRAEIARISIPWLPDTVGTWVPILEEAGARYGVDPELLAIIVLVESGGDPHAQSGAGAIGLMQVMPGTGQDIARWRGIEDFRTEALLDPAVAIDFGAWYLARQLASFGERDDPDWRHSVARAAAAYNGGPGSVSRWLAGGRLPAESERYRTFVLGMWNERSDGDSPTLQRWLQAGGNRLVEAAAARQAEQAEAHDGEHGSPLQDPDLRLDGSSVLGDSVALE